MSNTHGDNFDRWKTLMERIGLVPVYGTYDFTDKELCINTFIIYMIDRTASMFKWSGLPDTIPERSLELYLKLNGDCCIAEYDGSLYAFIGGRGGEPDPYYMPTLYTVANPGLKMSHVYNIGKDCVVIPNDTLYRGLLPLFERYAALLAETECSQRIAIINTRMMSLISAPDNGTLESAQDFLHDIEAGKLGVIADNTGGFLEGIKTQPYATQGAHYLTELIETMQYIKASFYNDIGLNANYNMKREAINSDESQLNDDALLPLIDDMLKQRQEYAEKVNEMFGTNISVDFNSSWKDNMEELEAQQELLEDSADPEPEEETPEEDNENVDDEKETE